MVQLAQDALTFVQAMAGVAITIATALTIYRMSKRAAGRI